MTRFLYVALFLSCQCTAHVEGLQQPRQNIKSFQILADGHTEAKPGALSDAATRSKTSTDTVFYKYIYGGLQHKDEEAEYAGYKFVEFFRPESTKTRWCEVSETGSRECHDCQESDSCWRNSGRPCHDADGNYLNTCFISWDWEIALQTPDDAKKEFELEVWAECEKKEQVRVEYQHKFWSPYIGNGEYGTANWRESSGGTLEVYDHAGNKRALTRSPHWDNGEESHFSTTKIEFGVNGKAEHVRVVWKPDACTSSSCPSKASVNLQLEPVVYTAGTAGWDHKDTSPFKDMDDCMAVKSCLQVLDSSTTAGRLLRDSNRLQHECLEHGTVAGESDDVNKMCDDWGKCLKQESQHARLKSLLAAAEFTPTGCTDTNNGATDTYGDGCEWYDDYATPTNGNCNGDWDDADFTAKDMCCACKEGSSLAAVAVHQRTNRSKPHSNLAKKLKDKQGSSSKTVNTPQKDGITGAADHQLLSRATGNTETPAGCLHPASADPESWNCDCAKEMDVECPSGKKECYHKLMCKAAKICDSWKSNHGCSTLGLLTQRAETETAVEKTMDESVSDKCVDVVAS